MKSYSSFSLNPILVFVCLKESLLRSDDCLLKQCNSVSYRFYSWCAVRLQLLIMCVLPWTDPRLVLQICLLHKPNLFQLHRIKRKLIFKSFSVLRVLWSRCSRVFFSLLVIPSSFLWMEWTMNNILLNIQLLPQLLIASLFIVMSILMEQVYGTWCKECILSWFLFMILLLTLSSQPRIL